MVPTVVRFWIYLILLIPSVLCALFVLYHLLFDRALRHALNNHVIVVLLIIGLIVELTAYPWMLYFYKYDGDWERSPLFCTIWGFADWGLSMTQTILFAWATIERHILVFHDKWVSTRKKRIFVHYLPLILLLLYCLLYYIIVDFFPPCENFYISDYTVCVYFCAFYIYEWYMWETVANQLVPVLIIALSTVLLFARVLRQKCRAHQPIQWRKHRKMAVQVLSISLLYMIFSFPFALATLLSLFGVSFSVYGYFLPYASFFSYFIILLFPFVCLLCLPTPHIRLAKLFHLRGRLLRRIHPTLAVVRPTQHNQAHLH